MCRTRANIHYVRVNVHGMNRIAFTLIVRSHVFMCVYCYTLHVLSNMYSVHSLGYYKYLLVACCIYLARFVLEYHHITTMRESSARLFNHVTCAYYTEWKCALCFRAQEVKEFSKVLSDSCVLWARNTKP